MGCSNIAAGWRYTIDPARLVVTGTTLTAGALRGARLWVNGYEYLVRDNTTSELQLIYPEDYRAGPVYEIVETGGTAYVLRGQSPSASVQTVATDGDTALWTATSGHLARFDGTAWERFDGTTFTTRLRAGTVSFASSSNVLVDTAGGMTPGALTSKRLFIQGQSLAITGNTANTITVSGSWGLQVPVPGTPYEVYEADGVTFAQTLLATGGTLWLGANTGLYRLTGSTWTRLTVASTESAPGAVDGLLSDDVERLMVLPNGDLYVTSMYSGVSRLRGTSWSTFTVANTETAPNRRDGLPDDDVYDVIDDGTGTLWFSTGSGAARLMGTSWATYGPAQGLSGWVGGVWLDPGGRVHLGNASGLHRIVP
jgi:ligand-binding sensor domain-containing protein